MIDVKIRPLSKEYIELLRQWRNENRRFFIDQKIITPSAQKEWFERYKKNKNDTIHIVFYNGVPVGSLSTKIVGDDIEVGRVILGRKEYARQGIMGEALEQQLSKFKNKRIFLRVRQDNKPAVSFYKEHRFCIVVEDRNCFVMERFV